MRQLTKALTLPLGSITEACPALAPSTVALITRARTSLAAGGSITPTDWRRWLGARKGGFRAARRAAVCGVCRTPLVDGRCPVEVAGAARAAMPVTAAIAAAVPDAAVERAAAIQRARVLLERWGARPQAFARLERKPRFTVTERTIFVPGI